MSLLGKWKGRKSGSEEGKLDAALPPFQSLTAAMAARINVWRTLFFITTVVCGSVIVTQQQIILHKLFQKLNEQVLIVPGSPEFFRVRPGQIPDESVFMFAEYVAENLGNFSYRNLDYHLGKVTAYMTPEVSQRLEMAIELRKKDWVARKLEQTFAYEPVRHFDIVNDDRGPKYVAGVAGVRTQYVEGHVFSETRDVLYTEFRAQGKLTPDHPFIFGIEKVEWMTPEQYQALLLARGTGAEKG